MPFSLAYLKAANICSNVDIVYPPVGEENSNENIGNWLEDRECPSPWQVLDFPEYLGICGQEYLLIGEDGKNDLHLTWLEE